MDFRPVEEGDIPYFWAAYKKGLFRTFNLPDGLDPMEFSMAFSEYVLENFTGTWTQLADTREGFIPVGLIGGVFVGPVMIVGDMIWMPWASKRNIYESAVNFIDEMRQKIMVMDFAAYKDRKFFDSISRIGIMKTGSRIHGLHPDGDRARDATLFYSVV